MAGVLIIMKCIIINKDEISYSQMLIFGHNTLLFNMLTYSAIQYIYQFEASVIMQ